MFIVGKVIVKHTTLAKVLAKSLDVSNLCEVEAIEG